VYRVAKALSNAGARMRVAAMTGGQTDKKERDKSFRTQVSVFLIEPSAILTWLLQSQMCFWICHCMYGRDRVASNC